MIKLIPSEDYAKYLINKMSVFIPKKGKESCFISAKFCAIQSVKENIDLLNFINQSIETPLTQYYKDVLIHLTKSKPIKI